MWPLQRAPQKNWATDEFLLVEEIHSRPIDIGAGYWVGSNWRLRFDLPERSGVYLLEREPNSREGVEILREGTVQRPRYIYSARMPSAWTFAADEAARPL